VRRTLKIVGWISALILFALLIGVFVILPSASDWSESRNISDALTDARAVTIAEFTRILDFSDDTPEREVTLQNITATPEQIARFHSATARFVSFGLPRAHARCWTPHHRLEIIRRDGSSFRVEICFQCTNMKLTPGHIFSIPARWLEPLHDFFTSIGMPPRTGEQYEQLAKNPNA
jgi:hypothetical protein